MGVGHSPFAERYRNRQGAVTTHSAADWPRFGGAPMLEAGLSGAFRFADPLDADLADLPLAVRGARSPGIRCKRTWE